MNRWLGVSVCWLLRLLGGKHKEGRLRKGEGLHIDAKQGRVCQRCGATRLAKARKRTSAKDGRECGRTGV